MQLSPLDRPCPRKKCVSQVVTKRAHFRWLSLHKGPFFFPYRFHTLSTPRVLPVQRLQWYLTYMVQFLSSFPLCSCCYCAHAAAGIQTGNASDTDSRDPPSPPTFWVFLHRVKYYWVLYCFFLLSKSWLHLKKTQNKTEKRRGAKYMSVDQQG